MREEKRKEKQMGDLEQKREKKSPRRIIRFSSGETLEEYSTEEEEDNEEKHAEKKDILSPIDVARLPWGPYMKFHMWRAATSTVSACDYVGERMASLLGLSTAKYQYAINEHNRKRKEEQEGVENIQVSEEAESHEEKRGEELNP